MIKLPVKRVPQKQETETEEKVAEETQEHLNDRPIIGILTQPTALDAFHDSYIMGAYVKWIQQGGARVVPVYNTLGDKEILDLMDQLNGMILPGGKVRLVKKDGSLHYFTEKSILIMNKAKELNDKGIHFPIWGVCQGIQQMAVAEAPFYDTLKIRTADAYDFSTTIKFVSDPTESKLYRNAPRHLLTALERENITYNAHKDCIMPETFFNYVALRDYTVIANCFDKSGVEYVSTIEHKKYPFFAVQSHPEKAAFVWITFRDIPHSRNAIEIGQYYANFFVNECRKNLSKFHDLEMEKKLQIENFTVKLTDGVLQESFIFKEQE